ncbi:5057_t:CDS:2 [Funneliformis caledonium]|uniref:5057_t:CDS:1 n=1 Tax=Funneliformis caledonium TaxID=1117310 RepID=A0A9N9AB08_9GLOM|nr:5057_t:CDS:2 [Funneliformis caledonium]
MTKNFKPSGQPYQYPSRVVKSEDNDMRVPPTVTSAVQGQAGATHGGTRGKHGHNGKDETSNDNNINELFVSTREALMTVLPQASDENIRKYERQLDDVEDFDPVLIISPNQNWINQHSLQAYQAVMNAFATDRLRQNNRRDENSLTVFHFANVTEMYNVRGNIRTRYPIAFYDPKAQPQQEPIGIAWILTKHLIKGGNKGWEVIIYPTHSDSIYYVAIKYVKILCVMKNELKKLHSTALFLKIKIFLNDLLIMGDNKDAEMRLHRDQTAIFYFSKVYFDEKEIENNLNFPTASGLSVSKIFELSLSQKTDLCSSHDLAPLVQEIFGIRKGFQKEKGFTKVFKNFEKDWRKKNIRTIR